MTDKTKIWKYMDFTKFVSLLDDQSLFFPRADKFEDPLEGSYTKMDKVLREKMLSQQAVSPEKISELEKFLGKLPQHVAINCWHKNEVESAAMWKVFLQNPKEGVAIQSSIDCLERSYFEWCKSSGRKVTLRNVNYIESYDNDFIPELRDAIQQGDIWLEPPFFYKRKSFEYEHEVRALIFPEYTHNEKNEIIPKKEHLIEDGGIKVKVDLSTLIEKVYVSPKSPEWFLSLVKSAMEKYGLNDKEVHQSFLDQTQPLY